MIINRIHEIQKPSVVVACFLRDLSALLYIYRGAIKSLARPTSRCILFDGENI